MAETEKMEALKKAYAEMILNTAKEAATRVMASEKVAIRCKHDLFATKDEALRLLVRFKQMIDAKIIEAEIASSSRQTKIDVLEAQLQEAEGVIIDLRDELNLVRDKLDKVRRRGNQVYPPFNGKITRDYVDECLYQNATPPESSVLQSDLGLQPVTTSDATNTSFNHKIFDNKYSDAQQMDKLSLPQFEAHSSCNAELASMIIRNKEPGYYRNGFTQRICALEGNILAGKLPPSAEADEHSIMKSDLIDKESNKDDVKFTLPSPKTKNSETVKSVPGEEIRKCVKVRTLRRRRTRFRKSKAKCKSCPGQLLKSYQQPSFLSRCKRYLASRNSELDDNSFIFIKTDNVNVNKNLKELEEKSHCQSGGFMDDQSGGFTDEKIIGHEGKRQRKVLNQDATSVSLPSYPEQHETCQPASTCSFSLYGNTKLVEDRPKTTDEKVKLKPLPRLDLGLTLIKGGGDPLSGSTNVTVSVKALNISGNAQDTANKDMELVDVLVKEKRETAVNSTFSCYESNNEMVNVPLLYSDIGDLKASKVSVVDVQAPGELEVSPSQVNNDRLLKHTFQRKRKKEALSSPDENKSTEKNTVKREAEEKQNDSSDLRKSSLINESSRNSRRLAEVARQGSARDILEIVNDFNLHHGADSTVGLFLYLEEDACNGENTFSLRNLKKLPLA